jgi:S-adenosyl methyltransferase
VPWSSFGTRLPSLLGPSGSGGVCRPLDAEPDRFCPLYDALLGGKDNYAADRQVFKAAPEVRDSARANRAFLQRAVRFLAGEAGIRQIIDVGTGTPAAGNVHEVAAQVAPGTRVAHVDNDPIVHVHANALLTGSGAAGSRRIRPGHLTGHIATRAQVAALFDGWDLVEPGLVQVPLWRPDGKLPRPRELDRVWVYGGVALKST